MKEFKVPESDVKAAFDIAYSPETKAILSALFYKSPMLNLDDYKTIRTYEGACIALGDDPIDEAELEKAGVPSHHISLMKLETVSRALWGQKFQPIPDPKNSKHYYYPRFALYIKEEIEDMDDGERDAVLHADASGWDGVGFGFLSADNHSSNAYMNAGFSLCQETEEKATYFGRQFIKLWSEYLAYNFTTGEKYAIE